MFIKSNCFYPFTFLFPQESPSPSFLVQIYQFTWNLISSIVAFPVWALWPYFPHLQTARLKRMPSPFLLFIMILRTILRHWYYSLNFWHFACLHHKLSTLIDFVRSITWVWVYWGHALKIGPVLLYLYLSLVPWWHLNIENIKENLTLILLG